MGVLVKDELVELIFKKFPEQSENLKKEGFYLLSEDDRLQMLLEIILVQQERIDFLEDELYKIDTRLTQIEPWDSSY